MQHNSNKQTYSAKQITLRTDVTVKTQWTASRIDCLGHRRTDRLSAWFGSCVLAKPTWCVKDC